MNAEWKIAITVAAGVLAYAGFVALEWLAGWVERRRGDAVRPALWTDLDAKGELAEKLDGPLVRKLDENRPAWREVTLETGGRTLLYRFLPNQVGLLVDVVRGQAERDDFPLSADEAMLVVDLAQAEFEKKAE